MPKKIITRNPEGPAPDAQIIFGRDMADVWLANAGYRLRNAFRSVRFDPKGMDPKQVPFLLSLVAQSILGDYHIILGDIDGTGVLYVPEALADQPALDVLKRGDPVDGYVAFYRKD